MSLIQSSVPRTLRSDFGVPSSLRGNPASTHFLKPVADHRRLHPPVAVEAPAEDEALLADAGVPAVRGLVAVQVGRLAVAVGGADPDDDAVLHVGAQQAVVGVVRRAREDEGRVVGELVAVDLLPAAVGHHLQRVARDERARRLAGRPPRRRRGSVPGRAAPPAPRPTRRRLREPGAACGRELPLPGTVAQPWTVHIGGGAQGRR